MGETVFLLHVSLRHKLHLGITNLLYCHTERQTLYVVFRSKIGLDIQGFRYDEK